MESLTRSVLTSGCIAMLAMACTSSHDVPLPPGLESELAQVSGSDPVTSERCKRQVEMSSDGLPNDLSCAGLFTDVPNRTLYSDARTYTPAKILWSDGASKLRWIRLPKGMKIDSSDQGEWKFPVGTRLFKEFGYDDVGPVETRLLQKDRSDHWASTTYLWNATHTEATRQDAGLYVDAGSMGMHYIPSSTECGQCHDGRKDQILGFEAVSLGQEGAEGLTLQQLIDEDLLTEPPAKPEMTMGDDGTGMGADVVTWLHINCGVSCHNDNQTAQAYATDLRMKLNPDDLDGRSASEFSAESTTIGVKVKTLQWSNQIRIVAGDPANSLLYKEISSRGGGKNSQMPPIASLRVDVPHTEMIEAWITSLASVTAEVSPN